jgi:hypothetical protein
LSEGVRNRLPQHLREKSRTSRKILSARRWISGDEIAHCFRRGRLNLLGRVLFRNSIASAGLNDLVDFDAVKDDNGRIAVPAEAIRIKDG